MSDAVAPTRQMSTTSSRRPRTRPETRVLKHGETFGVFDGFGDIAVGRRGQGLYHDGTRYLSRFACG